MALGQLLHDVARNIRFLFRTDTSQNGEQALLLGALPRQGLFLEIGCGHPVALSNTWALWRRGWSGTSYDAQQHLRPLWSLFRPGADFRQMAVMDRSVETAELFRFPAEWWVMSTADPSRATLVNERFGLTVDRLSVPARHIHNVWLDFVADHGAAPDLLHLDAEGLDVALLTSLFDLLPDTEIPQFVFIELMSGKSLPDSVLAQYREIGRVHSSALLRSRRSFDIGGLPEEETN